MQDLPGKEINIFNDYIKQGEFNYRYNDIKKMLIFLKHPLK